MLSSSWRLSFWNIPSSSLSVFYALHAVLCQLYAHNEGSSPSEFFLFQKFVAVTAWTTYFIYNHELLLLLNERFMNYLLKSQYKLVEIRGHVIEYFGGFRIIGKKEIL